MLPPRYLWLLLPLSCWCGYMTAPKHAAAGSGAEEGAEEARDPLVVAVAAGLAQTGKAELAEDLRNLLAQPESPERTKRLKLICARWAELDPAGALAWCEANKAPDFVRLRLLTEWALADSEAAWQAIAESKKGEIERSSVARALLNEDRGVFMQWFRKVKRMVPDEDPAWVLVAERHDKELLEIAQELQGSENGDYWARGLFALIARVRVQRDPAGTLEWASQLQPAELGKATLVAALKSWADEEPKEVWQHLDSGNTKGFDRGAETQVGQAILVRLAKEDPTAAIALLRDASDEMLSRRNAVEAVRGTFPALIASGKLTAVDAYRLIDSVKAGHGFLALNTMGEVFRALPADQLEAAAKAIAAEPPGQYRGEALGSIASAWMRQDPEAALAFVTALPDAGLRAQSYSGRFERPGGGFVEPERLGQILTDIPAADRARTFADFMSRYGDYVKGTESGQWSGPEFKPELLAPAFKDLPPSADLNRSVTLTAQEWGRSDPAAALAWADGFKDPAARSAAYAGTFQTWAARKPNEAAGWLADKPAGPERDAAALPVVQNLIQADTEIAWEWAGSIGDAGMRQEARLATLKVWAIRDPQAAQEAYRQISRKLSAAEAEKLSGCLGGS